MYVVYASRAPRKHCDLDALPSWLVKRAVDIDALVVVTICKLLCRLAFYATGRSAC